MDRSTTGREGSSGSGSPSAKRAPARTLAWALVAFGSAAILVGVVSPRGGLPAIQRLKHDVERLEQRQRVLRVQNAEMRSRIRALERAPEALEWQARAKLHWVRESERVYRGPQDPPQPVPQVDGAASMR